MRVSLHVCTCATLLFTSASAWADFTSEFFDRMFAEEAARLDGIDSLLKREETMGLTRLEYYEKASVDDDGTTIHYLRLLSPVEIQERYAPDSAMSEATPGDLRRAADALEQQGGRMEQGMREEMQKAGVPPGLGSILMNTDDDPRTLRDENQPWLSANPRDTMGMYATMLNAAAAGRESEALRRREEAAAAGKRRELAGLTHHVGETTVGGRPAQHFNATDLDYTQTTDDAATFTLQRIDMFVDAERYVPLLLRMQGEMTQAGGEPQPVTIEREERDYRRMEGCGDLYRPKQTVMRIKGMMTPEQEAEMREAQAKLAEFREQMKSMPEFQQDMIRRQMGPQMEMMEKMAAGGGLEVVSNTLELRCNAPMPTPLELAKGTLAGS